MALFQMEGFADKGLLIVGLGFMGGSLAKGLKKRGFDKPIYGLDINPEAIEVGKGCLLYTSPSPRD